MDFGPAEQLNVVAGPWAGEPEANRRQVSAAKARALRSPADWINTDQRSCPTLPQPDPL